MIEPTTRAGSPFVRMIGFAHGRASVAHVGRNAEGFLSPMATCFALRWSIVSLEPGCDARPGRDARTVAVRRLHASHRKDEAVRLKSSLEGSMLTGEGHAVRHGRAEPGRHRRAEPVLECVVGGRACTTIRPSPKLGAPRSHQSTRSLLRIWHPGRTNSSRGALLPARGPAACATGRRVSGAPVSGPTAYSCGIADRVVLNLRPRNQGDLPDLTGLGRGASWNPLLRRVPTHRMRNSW